MRFNVRILIVIVGLWLCPAENGFGQDTLETTKADSLRFLLNNAEEQQKVLEFSEQLAGYFNEKEQNDSAFIYYKKVVPLAKELNDSIRLAKAFGKIGVLSQYKGKYEQANEFNFKGLRLKEQLNAKAEDLASSHSNIALSYQELGLYDKAIEHQKKSLALFLKAKDSVNAAMRYYMIGGALYREQQYDTAKSYYDKAYFLYNKLGNKDFISIYHTYIGLIHLKKDRLFEAREAFQRSLDSYPDDGRKRTKVFIYTNLSVAHLVIGAERDSISLYHLRKAIYYAKQTYELAEELSFLSQMRKASELLYKAYERLGDYKNSTFYAKQYIKYNDSLITTEKQKVITEIQTKYETEKKEVEIQYLNKENQIKSENLDQAKALQESQRLAITLLVFGLLIIALLLVWLYKVYLQKKQSNQDLENKNRVIIDQNQEKELLLKEIHHRVKNNLQVVSSLLDLQTQGIEDESTLLAIEDGQSRVQAMALIHQNLYQNKDVGSISFRDYSNQLVRQLSAVYASGVEVQVETNMDIIHFDIDTAIPLGLILNELISNAYKYAFIDQGQKGKLELALKETATGNYELLIKDNGKGLPVDFDLNKTKSLGLRLVRRLSRQLYGKVTYHYEDGALFTVSFQDTQQRKKMN